MLRSEIAGRAGCSGEILRHYETKGLIDPPRRTANGYRHYGPRHLEQVVFIRSARELGFGLDEIRELMALDRRQDASCHPADQLARVHLNQIDEKIARLRELRGNLQTMINSCPSHVVADCRVLGTLSHGKALVGGG